MLERDITSKIMRYLKSLPNTFCWKQHGDAYSQSGIPDIICCFNGIFVAFEVKTTNGRLTKLQEVTMAKIREAKGYAFKVTDVEEVKYYLKTLEVHPNDSMEVY